MFLKSRDRIKKFYELITEANEFIKNEKYEDAIGLYNRINEAYNSIPTNMRTEALSKNLDKLNRELILYLKIKEINTLIMNKNFSRVPETIEYMNMIIFKLKEDTPKPVSLIKFGEEKIRYFKDLSEKEHEKHLFDIKYERIKDAIRKGDKKRAMLLFEDLKSKFKDVEKYGRVLDLFEKLEAVRKRLESPEPIRHKIHEYYEHTHFEKGKEPVKKVEKRIEQEKVRETNVEDELSQIHKLLDKNNVSEAKKLLKHL